MKSIILCLLLCVGIFLLAAGCGSQPVAESKHKSVSRDEIKSRVDSSTQDLDKVIKDVDVKTNVPTR
ncbi:hypothetical protein ACFL6F_00040 [Planctomycetota bacterium]